MSVSTPVAPGTTPGATPIIEVDFEKAPRPIHATDLSPGGGAAVAVSRVIVPGTVCELVGFRAVESTGAAAASFQIWDGSSNGGNLLAVIAMAAGGVDDMLFDSCGIVVATGKLWLQRIAGSIIGAVYWR